MNVMKRAWEIAREGQLKFGGKVKEYFAEALKMAWAEVKAEKIMKVVINFETEKMDLFLIKGGKIVEEVKGIEKDSSLELMADYTSSFGYTTHDHYAIVDGKEVYRGRHEATVRSA